MEEMVEVRKEVSDMPCGNAIPAEDAGHQTEKDVAGRESDRVPAPEMNPKVQLELLSGEGRKKAIGAVVIYNAVTIRGISVVENSKKNPFVKMPRAPRAPGPSTATLPTRSTGRRAKCSIPPCCRSMTGCGARKSSGGRKPSCKFPDLKTRPDECKSSSGLFCCSSSGQKRGKTMIVVECLYTSNEIEEETILREQQKRCLAAAASYGWAVRREVFEPLQLSARGMDDRTGIQTILDDVCNRRFDLLMIASMDRLSYDKEEVKAFLAEMDLNGISIFNVGSNTVTLASGWDLMAFIRQMISPENGGDAQ